MKVKTLTDILNYAYEHNWDLEKMRFMIGADTHEPKYFGIYQEVNGEWIVYKNKADGSTVVRYRGYNEAEACQIIFDKMQEEIQLRKTHNTKTDKRKKRRKYFIYALIIFTIVIVVFGVIASYSPKHKEGYYYVDDQVYYVQDGDWYYYDDYAGWNIYDGLVEDIWYDSYYGDSYTGIDSFYDTDYYIESNDDSYYGDNYDDDDDDTDWDFWDSWDSDDTDWDSDW